MQHIIEPTHFFTPRKGEIRVGQTMQWYTSGDYGAFLESAVDKGCRIALVGIPESIGPVGNLGKEGAERGWLAFLSSFCSIQDNRTLQGHKIAVAGTPDIARLQEEYQQLDKNDIQGIRSLVSRLDEKVSAAMQPIFKAGLMPVVIGGGHNNCYPIIKAACLACGSPLQAVNCDPHADFRALEGRHSGNGFSYAMKEGYLHKYLAIGLHQSYNSEEMLSRMDAEDRVAYAFFEDEQDPAAALQQYGGFLDTRMPTGIELDVDAIAGFPSSAKTPVGITLREAMAYLRNACLHFRPAYIHLPEASPGPDRAEIAYYGKALAYLVSTAIREIIKKDSRKGT